MKRLNAPVNASKAAAMKDFGEMKSRTLAGNTSMAAAMSKPFLTVLSYSGGQQSSCLLWQVIRGEIEKPFRFLVLTADPGMEDKRTYAYIRKMRDECAKAGIDFVIAQGPSLYNDILTSQFSGGMRVDNPPYYTKDESGKMGKLRQECTGYYKIEPMRRQLRKYLAQKYSVGGGQLRKGLVENWIGFSADEWHRCSESEVAYITLRFPLIEQKMDKAACVGYFLKNNLPMPPRSVCNACFANGLDYFKEMYNDRPDDWEKAVAVDNALESWKGRITEQEVFVSRSLIRLRDLPAINFGDGDDGVAEELHCNSGVCFV